jgi:hypothetical protein
MAERRLTYFALIHDQFLVDFLTERDVEEGRLRDYRALYVTDPCVSTAACTVIRRWVKNGGWLYGACAASSRNEFDEEQAGLADVFGIKPKPAVAVQSGRFDLRGALNNLPWMDQVHFASGRENFGGLGLKVKVVPTTSHVIGTFTDDTPAVLTNRFGKGVAVYAATCPAVSYAKDANFVPAELKEKWPAAQRRFINSIARASGAQRLVELSHPVVEAGVFDAGSATALVLANFTYEDIPRLEIRLPLKQTPRQVRSAESGSLPFEMEPASQRQIAQGYAKVARCTIELGLNDIVLFE